MEVLNFFDDFLRESHEFVFEVFVGVVHFRRIKLAGLMDEWIDGSMDFRIVGFLEPNNPILQKSSNPTIQCSFAPLLLVAISEHNTNPRRKHSIKKCVCKWYVREYFICHV